jgi:hypothetical protein
MSSADFPGLVACTAASPVLQLKYSSLLLVSEPEFHAEWLRDGPCDATTTGSSNLRQRCQLSLTLSGGEHEIRGASCIASR